MDTQQKHRPTQLTHISDGQLLELYLSLSQKQRDEQFAPTAQAAKIAGLSQRTIQLWIEVGAIRAVRVGRRYQVSSDSLRAYLKSLAE